MTEKKNHLHNLPEIIGQCFFKLPKFFEAWRYFQNAQKFWAEMKIIFNIYKVPIIIEQNKNSQNAKNIQASRLQNAQFLGQKWNKISIYNFPKQAEIS